MPARPKIKVTLSSFDKTLETICISLILVLWGLTLFAYFTLPDTIPTHYNASGEVDNYGSKTTLIFLPVLCTILFCGLTILNKHPNILNYVTPITEENAERQYKYATRMLRFIKLLIAIIFTLIVLFTYLTTIGKVHGPGAWFLPIVIVLTIVPTGYYINKSLKAN